MRIRSAALYLAMAFLMVVLAPQAARSQVLISLLLGDKVSSEKFHLGIDVGVNASGLSGIDGTKLRSGLFLGIIGEWRFARNWYLQPEVVPFNWGGAGVCL